MGFGASEVDGSRDYANLRGRSSITLERRTRVGHVGRLLRLDEGTFYDTQSALGAIEVVTEDVRGARLDRDVGARVGRVAENGAKRKFVVFLARSIRTG